MQLVIFAFFLRAPFRIETSDSATLIEIQTNEQSDAQHEPNDEPGGVDAAHSLRPYILRTAYGDLAHHQEVLVVVNSGKMNTIPLCAHCGTNPVKPRRSLATPWNTYCSRKCSAQARENGWRPTLEEAFWKKVTKSDGCWEWQGQRSPHGYGILRYTNTRRAHRVAYELFVGPIPAGLVVCHRCDNPPCCNPAHLFVGTNADNQHDSIAKGRRSWAGNRNPSRKNPGSHVGTRNGRAKLTPEAVVMIRDRIATGEKHADIARDFGVSTSTVQDIRHGRHWTHV